MFEKVNPSHPDKVADRIAGALVDLAYRYNENPRIAVEVLIGHGNCHIIAETSVTLDIEEVEAAVHRIAGDDVVVDLQQVPQDPLLAANQSEGIRCGDNGIFKGCVPTHEQRFLTDHMAFLYKHIPYDGKGVIDGADMTVCQSHCNGDESVFSLDDVVNPLGPWTGGIDVDTGATNRKLGSDMGDAVTGGGLHGKDLSKADVSVNIMCYLIAQLAKQDVYALCVIGDQDVTFKAADGKELVTMQYEEIVQRVRRYIEGLGGFEELAKWGLIRPMHDY